MSPDPHALTAALEAALLRELRTQIAWQNHVRFAGKLVPPVLVLSDATRRLGQWSRTARTLELSRALVLASPWPHVISVLEHELAHQYVDEVLKIHDEAAHGPAFQRVCAERGIDGRAAGVPVPSDAPAQEAERALDRIRKLLALAGSPNQHEAEVAMRKAHELMLRHNIEDASAHTSASYEVRHLGDPHTRGNRVEAEIAGHLLQLTILAAGADLAIAVVFRQKQLDDGPARFAHLARTGLHHHAFGNRHGTGRH